MKGKYSEGSGRDLFDGPYPTELLARHDTPLELPKTNKYTGYKNDLQLLEEMDIAGEYSLTNALTQFIGLYAGMRLGALAEGKNSFLGSPEFASQHLKSLAYFFQADLVGIIKLEDNPTGHLGSHTHGIVVAVGFDSRLSSEIEGAKWMIGTQQIRADTKAAEIVALLANFLRCNGITASSHIAGASELNLRHAAVASGIAEIKDNKLQHPLLCRGFGLAAVTTPVLLVPDTPLAPQKKQTNSWFHSLYKSLSFLQRFKEKQQADNKDNFTQQLDRDVYHAKLPSLRQDMLKDVAQKSTLSKSRLPELTIDDPCEIRTLRSMCRQVINMSQPIPAQALAPRTSDPALNQNAIASVAYYLGVDQVGFSHLDSSTLQHDQIFKNVTLLNSILLVVSENRSSWASIKEPKKWGDIAKEAAVLQATTAAQKIAYHLAELGYRSQVCNAMKSHLLLSPLMVSAGLLTYNANHDEWHSDKFGHRFQIAAVMTDMPLSATNIV